MNLSKSQHSQWVQRLRAATSDRLISSWKVMFVPLFICQRKVPKPRVLGLKRARALLCVCVRKMTFSDTDLYDAGVCYRVEQKLRVTLERREEFHTL